jgi:glycosyltransferase involved in cell wall biosynthesis
MGCGGMERYVYLLCNNINCNRFDVTLAILNNADPFLQVKNEAVTIIDLKIPQVRYAIFKVIALIKKNKPDIVYCTGNHLNLYLAIFRNFISRKVLIVARETSIVSQNNKRAKMPWLYNLLTKLFYSKLDFVISQSAYMQQDLIENYKLRQERSAVIYNPVETDDRFPQEIKADATMPCHFITVARLSEEKGIDRIIAAMVHLTIPFKYYIIGEGPLHGTLQQQIDTLQLQDHIYLLGQKDNPFNEIENVHLFLMGSRYEGLGNVLLEAAVRGIPCIAYNSPGGINEIITDGINGYLVPDNDAIAFAKAIEKAVNTNFNRPQIATAVAQKFSVEPIISSTENLFMQLYQKYINAW